MFHFFLLVHETIISGRYVEGGMGSVSLAIGNAAKEAGARIITRAEVYVSAITQSSSLFKSYQDAKS